jgi:hypothetical protein
MSEPTATRTAAAQLMTSSRETSAASPQLRCRPALKSPLVGCARWAVLGDHHARLRGLRLAGQRRGSGGVDRAEARAERLPVVDKPDAEREPDVKVGAEAEVRAERLDHHV